MTDDRPTLSPSAIAQAMLELDAIKRQHERRGLFGIPAPPRTIPRMNSDGVTLH
jgi:hypothetical protein